MIRAAMIGLGWWGRHMVNSIKGSDKLEITRLTRQIVVQLRPFFSDLVEVTRSLYSVGRKTQHDVLRAELELARLDDRLIEIERRRGQAQSELSQWLGDAARRPVADTLPSWDRVPDRDALHVPCTRCAQGTTPRRALRRYWSIAISVIQAAGS